ncbi:MAG TPA: 50S ribosomal protein L6 [Candidatus Bilamarchaeaceae archaeon]|nr:50S ribosomal protein L6 [Candidatus Bilamarchaeaceae archaeon]
MEMELPEKVDAVYADAKLTVKGPQGELSRPIPASLNVQVDGRKLRVDGKDDAMLNTYRAHIRNMLKGVQEGYETRLKIVYAHFPITVEVKGTGIVIKNFLGEKQARIARLFPPTKLEAKGTQVILKGPDKEAMGLTLASLRRAVRIRQKDPRVFQDGFYVAEE